MRMATVRAVAECRHRSGGWQDVTEAKRSLALVGPLQDPKANINFPSLKMAILVISTLLGITGYGRKSLQ